MLRKTVINGRIQFIIEKPLINHIINKKTYTEYVIPNIQKPIIEDINDKTPLKELNYTIKSNVIQTPIMSYKYSNIPIIDLNITIDHLKSNITIEKKSEIPYNIFQTWHTLELPFYMNQTVELLQTDNPEFNYYLYDDAMCREFIQSYFDEDTIYAYDSLVPGAYKADLWRYCILYVYGGIYLDIKYKCVNDFKLSTLMNKEQYVRDYFDGIYQAFLICLPKNEILMKCIHQIIIHVKTKSYLATALSITGPQLINKFFTKKQIKNLNMELIMPNILLNNTPILTMYSEYKDEQIKNELYPHYSVLWEKNEVYS